MAKKNNADYWKERFAALENSQYTASEAYCKDLQKQFRMATNDIQMDLDRWYQRLAENNNISYASAKKLLKKDELEEFHWSVEQYIKYGKENGINQKWMKELENASAKVHISRLEAMKLQIQQHAEKLFTECEGGTSKLLNKTFSSGYYKTAFEVAKGTGVGSDLHKIDTRKIDALIRRPWAQDGASFSDRIWTHKQKLINTLHTELSQNIIRGSDLKTAIANIAKTMNVSRSAAETLVRTESAAITSEATKQCYKDLGLEKYEILATLDSKTSDICQDLDGKIFDMKEYEVGVTAPPFHPRCRTTTVPYYEDMVSESEERAARDEETGKTYYVPANLSYKEWEKQFVHKTGEQEKSSRKNQISSVNWNYIKSKKYREKFDHISNNQEVNQNIYKKAMDMLKHRNNTDYEDMYLFDAITGKVIAAQTHSSAILGVIYNENIKRVLMKSKPNTLISVHNHPRNTPPSGGDFVSSARNKYKQGIIVCHNGDIYLYKAGKKPFTSGLFDRKVIEYQGRPYYLDEKEAYIKVLNQFKEEYGIQWEEIK